RLLQRAGRRAWAVAPDPGAVRRLHREPEGEPVPVAAHDGDGDRRAAAGGADPHARDAPARRARRGGALALQGGVEPRRAVRGTAFVAAAAARVAARDVAGGGVRRVGEGGPLPGPGVRLHAEGRDQGDAGGGDADRLRVPGAHGAGAPLRRREGERAARAAELPAEERRRRRDRVVEGAAGAVARLAEPEPRIREDRTLEGEDPAVVQEAGARGEYRARARDHREGAAAAEHLARRAR